MWQWQAKPGNSISWSSGILKYGQACTFSSYSVIAHRMRRTETEQGWMRAVSFHLRQCCGMEEVVSWQRYLYLLLRGQFGSTLFLAGLASSSTLKPDILPLGVLVVSFYRQSLLKPWKTISASLFVMLFSIQSHSCPSVSEANLLNLLLRRKSTSYCEHSSCTMRSVQVWTSWKLTRCKWMGCASTRVLMKSQSSVVPILGLSLAPISNMQCPFITNLPSLGRLSRGRMRLTAMALLLTRERLVKGCLRLIGRVVVLGASGTLTSWNRYLTTVPPILPSLQVRQKYCTSLGIPLAWLKVASSSILSADPKSNLS